MVKNDFKQKIYAENGYSFKIWFTCFNSSGLSHFKFGAIDFGKEKTFFCHIPLSVVSHEYLNPDMQAWPKIDMSIWLALIALEI